MRFIYSKAGIILIAFMSALCLIAIVISFKVSVLMLQRQHQVIREPARLDENINTVADDKGINPNKITEQEFYFNGVKSLKISSYSGDSADVYIPLDSVLDSLGIEYRFYSPDDIFETEVSGKKIVIKLGVPSVRIGDEDIILSLAPVALKDHILVPVDLFNRLDGFSASGHILSKAAFLNYYPGYDTQDIQGLKVLRLSGGGAEVSGVDGKKVFWENNVMQYEDDFIELSKDNRTPILISEGSVYKIIANGADVSLVKLPADQSAILSDTGRFLYWFDYNSKSWILYDVENGIQAALPQYPSGITVEGKELLPQGAVMYIENSGMDVGTALNMLGSLIEGLKAKMPANAQITGNLDFSPNWQNALFKDIHGTTCIYTGNCSDIKLLGNLKEADWVSNSTFITRDDSGMFLIDSSLTSRIKAAAKWIMLGQSAQGGVFFSDSTNIFLEAEGIVSKVATMPFKCNSLKPITSQGPYFVDSGDDGTIYYVNGTQLLKVGRFNQLLRKITQGRAAYDFQNSIAISPMQDKAVLFQRGDRFVSLNIIQTNDFKLKKIVLDLSSNSIADEFKAVWTAPDRLLVYTQNEGWIIDIDQDISIYKWNEQEGSTIQMVLP